MMIEWGNSIKNEVDLLEVNFNTFFKYQRESNMGFREYFERIQHLEKVFLEHKEALEQRK